jgi:spore germination protein KC
MQGILETGYPNPQKLNLIQQVTASSSKIKPMLTKNGLEIIVDVSEEGNIGEQDGSLKLTAPGMIRSLEQSKAAEMRSEIKNCLRKCQQFQADIFGFGEEIERRFPKEWKGLRPRWDTEFSQLKVIVHTKAKIRGTGFINNPINLK